MNSDEATDKHLPEGTGTIRVGDDKHSPIKSGRVSDLSLSMSSSYVDVDSFCVEDTQEASPHLVEESEPNGTGHQDQAEPPAHGKDFQAALFDAKKLLDKVIAERDHLRLEHRRVKVERDRLMSDARRLKSHYARYEPVIETLKYATSTSHICTKRQKYETLMKEKTLLRIDRDRLAKQVELQGTLRDSPTTKVNQRGKKGDSKSWSPWPSYRVTQSSPVWSGTDQSLSCRSSVSSQDSAITSICHFEGPSFLTCSDDGSVRLISDISVPSDSQLIGVHEHTFASGLAFHPSSNRVISSGGNGEIKIWNPNPLIEEKPVTVFKEHRSCVWSLDVADEYLLTASLDHTAKLIDLSVGRCRHTLRGHLDSVNKSIFSKKNPDLVYTCSADKSVSLWDCRTAHCSWTLFEHSAAVSDVAVFDLVASCDPSGCVIISDPRMGVLERFPLAMKTNVVTWLGGKLIAVAGSCMQLLTLGTAETPEKIFPASPSEAEIFSLCVSERTALLTSTETGYIQSWC